MSLILSPVMLVSSKMTLVVFQMMTRNTCLVEKYGAIASYLSTFKEMSLRVIRSISSLPFSLAWGNIKRSSRKSKAFGENINPHLKTSLKETKYEYKIRVSSFDIISIFTTLLLNSQILLVRISVVPAGLY